MPKTDSTLLDSRKKGEMSEIIDFVLGVSKEMTRYIETNNKSTYILFYKNITHSDLPTFAKATAQNSHENNLLYYITTAEMKQIEVKTGKPFQTAKQSNIGLSKTFYELMNVPDPRDVDSYLLDDYMNVYLVNETVRFFDHDNTWRVFNKLNKRISNDKLHEWTKSNMDVSLSNDTFTKINIHIARHGIGTTDDEELRKLRHNIFNGDTLALLYEYNFNENKKKLFVLTKKNPIFYSLTDQTDISYNTYQQEIGKIVSSEVSAQEETETKVSREEITEDVIRRQQGAWRKSLAAEMMAYCGEPNHVFCPFTYISADFDDLGQLFVASHIKGVNDPNTTPEERYDINNGLLLSSNADKLFDKHLITVDQNKKLVFSKVFDGQDELKEVLLLNQDIFEPILNEKRMKYLAYHEKVFREEEKTRTTIVRKI